MNLIYFKNPKFNRGLNFTVRIGENWKQRVSVGDVLEVHHKEKKKIIIEKIYVCKFKDTPKEVYEREHDEDCKNREGLRKVLDRYYSLKSSVNSVVTCLGFRVLPKSKRLKEGKR